MGFSLPSLIRRSPAAAGIALLAYLLLAAGLIWYTEKIRIEHEREHAADLAGEYALAVQMNIEQALSSAYALATMVQLNKGDMPEFDTVAAAMRAFYPGVSSLQLAPGGVISRIDPLAGNEKALGHDLLADPARDKEAVLARDTGKFTLAGPFRLLQGGLGAAGRLPVYLDDKSGGKHFWGFVVVLIRFPEALAPVRLTQLAERGYDYAIWRMHPDSGTRQTIAASSTRALHDPAQRTLHVPNATWTLDVAPAGGWISRPMLAAKIALALFVLMLAVVSGAVAGRGNRS